MINSENQQISTLETELARLRAENDEMRVQIEANKRKGGGCQCADDEACAHVRRAEKAEKLWKEFITLMEITEESDSGYEFNPNKISSCRAIDGRRLNEILIEARQIVF